MKRRFATQHSLIRSDPMTVQDAVIGIWFLPQWSGYSYRFTNEAGDAMYGHAWRGESGRWQHHRVSQMDALDRCGHLLEAHDGCRREGQFPNGAELAAINQALDARKVSQLR